MNERPLIRIDIRRCLHLLWKKKWGVFAMATVAFLLAYLLTWGSGAVNIYSAVATVYSTAEGGFSLAQAQETTTAMQRYVDVASSQKVLNRASDLITEAQVSGEELAQMITVSYESDSSILYVAARSESPILAVSAANAVAAAFVTEITAITGQNTAQVLDVAAKYELETDSRMIRWGIRLLAALGAAFCYCVYILLRDIFSTRINSAYRASLKEQLEILGYIPDLNMAEKRK